MKQNRIIYFIIVIITIATGLFVRIKHAWFPDIVNLYLGDVLYAFMMFYIISCIVPEKRIGIRAITALVICFAIELLQLYQTDWINAVRETLPGKLILGSGFLWSDLLAYVIGVLAAYIFEKIMLSKGNLAH